MKTMAEKSRTDLSSAVQQVMRVLSDGRPYTIASLAREANLNFRTVKKAVELLGLFQNTMQSKRIDISATSEKHTIIQVREKSGLASLPENIQSMVIRAIYPEISEEERVLAHLLNRGAISEKTAIQMPESEALTVLLEAEHVLSSGTRFYLSKDALMIAKGALSTYSELQKL